MKNKIIYLLTFYAVLLVFIRVFFTHSGFYLFLIWNLFLAFIPFWISKFIYYKKSKIVLFSLFPIWLIFIPNAPYIITDLFHLEKGIKMPIWFDLLLVSSFVINGLILFFLSIKHVHQTIEFHYNKVKANLLSFVTFLLTGFGIYIGRYLRWNSWDILSPNKMINDLITILGNPELNKKPIGITFGYGILFFICFLFMQAKSIKTE